MNRIEHTGVAARTTVSLRQIDGPVRQAEETADGSAKLAGGQLRDVGVICPTGNLRMSTMRNLPVVPFCRRRGACDTPPIYFTFTPFRTRKRGASRSSRTLGAGCDGRCDINRRVMSQADGEVVWS
jgi:hypothetical protein